MRMLSNKSLLAVVSVTLLATACSDGGDGQSNTLRIALKVLGPGTANTVVADSCGNDLTKADLVLHELELEDEEQDPYSADVESGPFLLKLAGTDFNGVLRKDVIEMQLPRGVYDEIHFEIAKLDPDDPNDVAAAQADPDLDVMLQGGLSVDIAGTDSGGESLSFVSDLDETQDKSINPPIVVGDTVSGIDGMTLSINPALWFVHPDTQACLDLKDPANRSQISDNIRRSIDVEEDDDADGINDAEDRRDDSGNAEV